MGARVGSGVVAGVGVSVGAGVGVEVGARDGVGIGTGLGLKVGAVVGDSVCKGEGVEVGAGEGVDVGAGVGLHAQTACAMMPITCALHAVVAAQMAVSPAATVDRYRRRSSTPPGVGVNSSVLSVSCVGAAMIV